MTRFLYNNRNVIEKTRKKNESRPSNYFISSLASANWASLTYVVHVKIINY